MINPDRQIVLDTETTGMNQIGAHYEGHCIIEIGAVEMINRKYTHIYIKPDRLVDPDAIKVHGITDEMLADKPDFKTIAQDFIEYIRGAELLIHNAPFDVGFMDYEFRKLGLDIKTTDICLLSMTGGQTSLFDEDHADSSIIQAGANMQDLQSAVNFSQNLKVLQPTDDELQAHLDFIKLVNKKSDGKCFWSIRTGDETSH